MSKTRLSIQAPKLHATWVTWIQENFAQLQAPEALYEIMRRKGFGQGQIEAGLGRRYPQIETDAFGRDASGRIFDYETVANCRLTRTQVPNLKRVPTNKAQIYIWDEFISAEDCEALMQLTDMRLLDSTISGESDPQYAKFRTSRTCMLDELGSAIADDLTSKICDALGLSASWSEPNQAQKYEIGQEFKAHTDYFEPGAEEYDRHCKERGQRTWTFMIYLNTVEEGGATRFRKLEKTFKPKQGQALTWNSLTPDGDPNPWTIHHGTKVRKGEKYVITKWFRDKGEGPMLQGDQD